MGISASMPRNKNEFEYLRNEFVNYLLCNTKTGGTQSMQAGYCKGDSGRVGNDSIEYRYD